MAQIWLTSYSNISVLVCVGEKTKNFYQKNLKIFIKIFIQYEPECGNFGLLLPSHSTD